MGGRGWRIARIGGVDIRVDSSWVVIAALIVYSRWVVFGDPARFPGTGTAGALAFAVLAAILFFGSVLVHETAHAVTSILRHIEVESITLWMFGGATQQRTESRGPLDEFLVAGVGPAASLALGLVFLLVDPALPAGPAREVFRDLGGINLLLAAFNVLPGFPLDGGRLLRAAVWRATGSQSKATIVAARVGQAFGIALVAVGLAAGIARQDFGLLWLALIGWFLLQAATITIGEDRRRRLLSASRVRDVMSPPPPSIPADLPVAEAARFFDSHQGEAFPVMDDGRVVGFVSASTAAAVAPDRPVREATVDPGTVLQARPEESMEDVTDRLGEERTAAVLVVDAGRLVGVIEPEDVERLFSRHRRRRIGRS